MKYLVLSFVFGFIAASLAQFMDSSEPFVVFFATAAAISVIIAALVEGTKAI